MKSLYKKISENPTNSCIKRFNNKVTNKKPASVYWSLCNSSRHHSKLHLLNPGIMVEIAIEEYNA